MVIAPSCGQTTAIEMKFNSIYIHFSSHFTNIGLEKQGHSKMSKKRASIFCFLSRFSAIKTVVQGGS